MKMELGNRVDECNDEGVNLTRVKHNLTLSQRNATNIIVQSCSALLPEESSQGGLSKTITGGNWPSFTN